MGYTMRQAVMAAIHAKALRLNSAAVQVCGQAGAPAPQGVATG